MSGCHRGQLDDGFIAQTCDGFQRHKAGRPQGFDIGPERELAPNPEALYAALRRVNLEVRGEAVTDAEIEARFAAQDQMLCIVNTRGHAKSLFDLIKGQQGARHLTTLMCPAHRRQVLADIKADLLNGRPVRLVATSLVEAGVDSSFPEVWRVETGLDSIAQAAGRCNRGGGPVAGRVVVFAPAEQTLPRAFRAVRDAAHLPLQQPDALGLDAVRQYFKNLYFNRDFMELDAVIIDDLPGILPAIRRTPLKYPFAAIAYGFRLIEDTMRDVIIPCSKEGSTALAAMRGDVRPGWAVRRLQQYTVGIPQKAWHGLLATGAVQPVNPKFGDRFVVLASDGL